MAFIDHTDEVLAAMDAKADAILEAWGQNGEARAKLNISNNHSVITSRLINSITHEVHGDTVYISTDVEYAPYVELGHHQEPGRYVPAIGKRLVRSFVPGKPFLRPAVVEHRDEYKRIAQNILNG